jgi:hypothetical protein
MSSPKTAVAKAPLAKGTRRPKAAARPAAATPAPDQATDAALADTARRLAAEIERGLAEGRTLNPEALQVLMGALCRSYGAHVESDPGALPLKARGSVSNTDIMIMASALLRSANLAVFELGMWQSWTGR